VTVVRKGKDWKGHLLGIALMVAALAYLAPKRFRRLPASQLPLGTNRADDLDPYGRRRIHNVQAWAAGVSENCLRDDDRSDCFGERRRPGAPSCHRAQLSLAVIRRTGRTPASEPELKRTVADAPQTVLKTAGLASTTVH
jgi:hypothetical protein